MERLSQRFLGTPPRLSSGRAWLALGAAATFFAMAVAWLAVDPAPGFARLLGPAFFALAGVADVCWATGSLLPEERGGAALRGVVRPLRGALLAAGIVALARFTLLLAGAPLPR